MKKIFMSSFADEVKIIAGAVSPIIIFIIGFIAILFLTIRKKYPE